MEIDGQYDFTEWDTRKEKKDSDGVLEVYPTEVPQYGSTHI